jgi:hypothetical protein
MSRMLAVLVAVALGAAATLAIAPRDGARAADPTPTVLKVGDRVQVEGQPVGCRVANQGGNVVMDCRRAGALAGTYGTMISSRTAKVVRFRSDTVAKVVYTAKHHGGARACR